MSSSVSELLPPPTITTCTCSYTYMYMYIHVCPHSPGKYTFLPPVLLDTWIVMNFSLLAKSLWKEKWVEPMNTYLNMRLYMYRTHTLSYMCVCTMHTYTHTHTLYDTWYIHPLYAGINVSVQWLCAVWLHTTMHKLHITHIHTLPDHWCQHST